MKIEDIVNIALTEWYYDRTYKKLKKTIDDYKYNSIKRYIKITNSISPYKINVLNRLLKKTGNNDINIIVGVPKI